MSKEKLEVFNVLNFLNSGYELEDILENGNFEKFSSSKECIEYLIDGEYIENISINGQITAEEISKNYTVTQLKDLLKQNNLKVSGKKQELVERVLPILSGEGTLDNFTDSSNLKLTVKAQEFLKENEWIDLYMYALVVFRFEDYETYVENSSSDNIETALKFCDEIISRALLANQFLVLIEALSAKSHVYAYDGNYEKFLDYDLQRFILGLNPIMLDSKDYPNYKIIDYANIINLRNVLDKLDFGSLKKRFDKIWVKSHIKDITIPKKTSYKILKKAIGGADIEKLNFELREKYFDKKFGI